MLSFLTFVTVCTLLLVFLDVSKAVSKVQQKQQQQKVAAAAFGKAKTPEKRQKPEPEPEPPAPTPPVVEETTTQATEVPEEDKEETTEEEDSESTVIDESKATDTCDWLPEKLTGRCWGLTNHHEVKGMKLKANKINNAMDCQKLCCDLGDQCATFQYIVGTKSCHVGPEVRLGKEKGKTDIWCDDVAPHKWSGHVLIHNRVGMSSLSSPLLIISLPCLYSPILNHHANPHIYPSPYTIGTCSWGTPIPYQCWDFGDERLSETGERLNDRSFPSSSPRTLL